MAEESIVLGGGCFWCVEAAYRRIDGVISCVSGYAGGSTPNPTYRQVCTGNTGHAEVVRVTYDPSVISRDEILEYFWKMHDPTTLNRQGADVGTQYRSAIFVTDEAEAESARRSIAEAQPLFTDPIVTTVEELGEFYPAEDYHRDYYELNPRQGYCRAVIEPKLRKLGFNVEPLKQ